MTERPRKPAAFRLDDPDVDGDGRAEPAGRGRAVVVTPDPEPALPVPFEPVPRAPGAGGVGAPCSGRPAAGSSCSASASASRDWSRTCSPTRTASAISAPCSRRSRSLRSSSSSPVRRLGSGASPPSSGCTRAPPKTLINDDRTDGRAVVRELIAFERSTPASRARARGSRDAPHRDHRRRRPDPPRRARTDGAARRAGAPHGLRAPPSACRWSPR